MYTPSEYTPSQYTPSSLIDGVYSASAYQKESYKASSFTLDLTDFVAFGDNVMVEVLGHGPFALGAKTVLLGRVLSTGGEVEGIVAGDEVLLAADTVSDYVCLGEHAVLLPYTLVRAVRESSL